MSNNPRESILERYGGLAEGLSLSGENCPRCTGGSSKENSLSVARQSDTLLWICHRASCGFRGTEHLLLISTSRNFGAGPPTTKPKLIFTPIKIGWPQPYGAWLTRTYGLNKKISDIFGLEWTNDYCTTNFAGHGRIVIPLKNRDLTRAGTLLRASNKDEPKKVITIKDKDPMGLIWFNCTEGPSSNVIIVEDCYSALRMTEHMNAVALLGTHLSKDNVDELKSWGLNKYYLALDKDALSKAINYSQQYKNKLKLEVVSLERDIKNMSTFEFSDFINTLKKEESDAS